MQTLVAVAPVSAGYWIFHAFRAARLGARRHQVLTMPVTTKDLHRRADPQLRPGSIVPAYAQAIELHELGLVELDRDAVPEGVQCSVCSRGHQSGFRACRRVGTRSCLHTRPRKLSLSPHLCSQATVNHTKARISVNRSRFQRWAVRAGAITSGPLVLPAYSGMLSCFFSGISSVLVRSMDSARAIRRRVKCGMITSSI